MKSRPVVEFEATITERGQTTIPTAIRKMLSLRKHDHVVFRGLADGTVVIEKREERAEEDDPALAPFLAFLEKDMAARPEAIRSIPRDYLDDLEELKGVTVDLDSPLPDDEM